MKDHSIATVISFCSNDWRFISRCIEGVNPFSQRVVVTVCDHFFDGSPERYDLLEGVYRRYPTVRFIEFAYDPNNSYNPYSTYQADHPLMRHEWHNTGRWIAYLFSEEPVEYLYFCDCDEITDSDRFIKWLDSSAYRSCDAMRLACYWYFREACYRALTEDDMCLLIRKEALQSEMLWSEHERMGTYLNISGPKQLQVRGIDDQPLVHHYSWVRTKEELHKKFAAWGHFWERDWERLVDQEFDTPFKGMDFIRGYSYIEERPVFDPLAIEVPPLRSISLDQHIENVKLFDNVRRVDRQEMFRRELKHVFNLRDC